MCLSISPIESYAKIELKSDKHVWAWEWGHLKDIYEKAFEPNFEMFSANILRFTEDRKHGIFKNRRDYSKFSKIE